MPRPATQERINAGQALGASAILLATTVAIYVSLSSIRGSVCDRTAACDRFELFLHYYVVGFGSLVVFLSAYGIYPRVQELCCRFRSRWRSGYTAAALAGVSALFASFIVYFGNRGFGAFDFSALIDAGWRLSAGQEPYRDFITTFPPGFYLGAKYAFLAFGAKWDSQLYADALLACISFVWIYHLLGDLLESRVSSFLVAIVIECCTLLPLSFWWYNSLTSITATIFFLSCFVYLSFPRQVWPQLSYVAALAALCLMKPNIAAPLAILGVLLVLVITGSKTRFLLLTGIAVTGAVVILTLAAVDIPGMIFSYRAAAEHRGVLSTIGVTKDIRAVDLLRAGLYVLVLSAPLWLLRRGLIQALRVADTSGVARYLLLGLGPAIGILGMISNVDSKDIEWPMLICAGVMVLLGRPGQLALNRRPPGAVRLYAAFLCSLALADIYVGAVRYRVEGIGVHRFFEWNDSSHDPGIPFFQNLRASAGFKTTVSQVNDVLRRYPGPVFFGPRMEFNYGAFGIASPTHLPILWDPGNQFSTSEERSILVSWQQHRFATLVFLKDDFTFYTPQFWQLIDTRFSRDDSYSTLTVFHAKPGVISTGPLRTPDGASNE